MNFVFTSAGNNTKFNKLWLGKKQNYDVYVVYYGDNNDVYNNYKNNTFITFCEKRKGSKFQNFLYFYKTYPEIIDKYDRFFILDDDIVFRIDDINKMFELSRKHNLEICGPSFKKGSKISHNITIHRENTELIYTNFVEVNTMLFNKTALTNLMKYMIPELIGWGIDILAIWANGLDKKNAYGIIHCVECINPTDNIKHNWRELYYIKNSKQRRIIYETYIKKLGIYDILEPFVNKEYSCVKKRYNEMINAINTNRFRNKPSLLLFKPRNGKR